MELYLHLLPLPRPNEFPSLKIISSITKTDSSRSKHADLYLNAYTPQILEDNNLLKKKMILIQNISHK